MVGRDGTLTVYPLPNFLQNLNSSDMDSPHSHDFSIGEKFREGEDPV